MSYDVLNGLTVNVNVKDQGKGLFSVMKHLGFDDPIGSDIVRVTHTSLYNGRKDASCLIYWNDSVGWSSQSSVGEYFELSFPLLYVELRGYSFRSVDYDPDVPRNWNVECADGRVIHSVKNNNTLCNGVQGNTKCGFTDEKAFYTTRRLKCNKIRFVSAGPDSSSDSCYLVLSGIELFGSLFYKNYPISTCKQRKYKHYDCLVSLFLCICIIE
jgi:hypothetical protein